MTATADIGLTKLNAIDNDMALELLHADRHGCQATRKLTCLLLRGAGRAFCAGRDVGAPRQAGPELVQAVAAALVALPKPVVAAVHGWTLGAGLEWGARRGLVLAAEEQPLQVAGGVPGSSSSRVD
jgi:2-(1,2-epoxy-1,2-dihydrophenyl)acetyl-CoA isomerase